ncbi:MAG TPA: universal stress protein [Acidimicrobiales bacterium]|nr:universal stress protein [Acidimicrobiales bacterium]
MALRRIVVGVDGSDNAAVAVAWAASLAAATGAEVVAVHALGLLDHLGPGDPVLAQPHRDEIGLEFEKAWCAPLDEPGVACRKVMRDGPPADVLLAEADEVGADLIVVGSRGVGTVAELVLGSTSTQVARRSTRPVTIVPIGVRPRPAG